MDNDNLYMNTPEVNAKIERLRKERDIMNNALVLIKDQILNMPNIWNGNTGDENYEVLVKYSVRFQEVIGKIDEFIDKLDEYKTLYEIHEKAINDKIDSNVQIKAA